MVKSRRRSSRQVVTEEVESLLDGSASSQSHDVSTSRGYNHQSLHDEDDENNHGNSTQNAANTAAASTSVATARSSVSFDKTAVPPENRFVPLHYPKQQQQQQQQTPIGKNGIARAGALQFVPAYEESTSPVITTTTTGATSSRKAAATAAAAAATVVMEEEPAPTWDAIIEAENTRGRSLSWGRRNSKSNKVHSSSKTNKSHSADRSISSVESAGTGIFRRRGGRKHTSLRGSPVRSGSSKSPGKRPIGTALPRTSISPGKQRPVPNEITSNNTPRGNKTATEQRESASVVSTMSSRKGTRIARLASLFSSRITAHAHMKDEPPTTPDTKQQPLASKTSPADAVTTTPVSPPRSSHTDSSSGYIGWPGTQDKRGGTVAVQSSYDDSSIGGGGGPTTTPQTPHAFFHRKKYELEMDDNAVEEEVRKWMNDPSFDDSIATSDRSSPRRPMTTSHTNSSSYDEPRGNHSFASKGSNRLLSDDSLEEEEDENPADFHLAAVVAESAASRSPLAETTPSSQHAPKYKRLLNGFHAKGESTPYKTGVPGYSSRPRSTKSSSGASRTGTASVAASSTTGALSINNLFADERKPKTSPSKEQIKQAFNDDPWEVDDEDEDDYDRPPSSTGTSVSKSSSAFYQTRGVSESKYGIEPNMRSASGNHRKKSDSQAKSSPPIPENAQPPTEEALKMNDKFSQTRQISAANVRGYRGYLDKTKDVPNLMDTIDSESASSSKATSAYMPSNLQIQRNSSAARAPQEDIDEASDIFDGLSTTETDIFSSAGVEALDGNGKQGKSEGVNVVRLAGGLTTIQATKSDLENRRNAGDFDENLSNSSIDHQGYAKLPAFREMAAAGRKSNDAAKYTGPSNSLLSSTGQPVRNSRPRSPTSRSVFESTLSVSESGASQLSDNAQLGTLRGYYHEDLSEYSVNARQVKQLVKRYRELCASEAEYLTQEEIDIQEDEKKAFALLEMRSRVMEKDMERGLERQGGTVPVDDLVTTRYNQAANRIRDAVIVSKAWRDGASPKDVTTASLLTRAGERMHYVKRPIWTRGKSWRNNYYLEPVRWLDDTDFMQFRCPSLGPRCMRGFEIFTVGDCQSILLKLTNERCMNLRDQLNEATARQLEAEELMKEEVDTGDGMMTEAEMTYLASMEEVKTISKRLVVAEKSFELVRERIQMLVSKYETLLAKIENDSIVSPSSVLTNGSSYYTNDYDENYSSEEDDEEKIKLARRAKRAELRAEVAAREAMLAKQEAAKVKEEKQRELEALQQKLVELQAESSTAVAERDPREQSAVLAKNIAAETQSAVQERATPRISQEKINGVKQRFRDRMAERMRASSVTTTASPRRSPPAPERPMERSPPSGSQNNRLRITAGEEIYKSLDFYERSLKAVERSRSGTHSGKHNM